MTSQQTEQIVVGSCPTCGGPAQFIDPADAPDLPVFTGAGGAVAIRHVSLQAVPLRRVLAELREERDACRPGGERATWGAAMSIVERELAETEPG